MEEKLKINFLDVPPAEAGQLAIDLQEYLNYNVAQEAEIVKERQDTMDFGATLVLVLGTGSAMAIAKGIANWLSKRSQVKIVIKSKDEEIVGENLTSKDISTFLDKVNSRQSAA